MGASTACKLSLGLSTYDDYDGVYFTVQAIRLYHPEITDETEILILDNRPSGSGAAALRQLAEKAARCRYLPTDERVGTAVRDLVFREARAPYVLCMDSHVLFAAGALRRLIDYFDRHPTCRDLLQGPILWDEMTVGSTHFEPRWSSGMYGVWERDPRGEDADGEPFEIPMHGLGVFACRRDAWPGFNPRFSGFGAEEGYIHEKFRRAGGRVLCLPFLRWLHRFQRPLGIPYPNVWEDRLRNYAVGLQELGLDIDAMADHFREHLGAASVEPMLSRVRRELASPFSRFDALFCVSADDDREWALRAATVRQATGVQALRRWRRIAVDGDSPAASEALIHRAIVERARLQALESVLVVEAEALFADDAPARLDAAMADLRARPWSVFDLGDGAAVAYDRSAYETLLRDLPEDAAAAKRFVAAHGSLASYRAALGAVCVASRSPIVRRATAIEQALGSEAFRRPRARPGLLVEALDDEVLLYDPERSAAIRLNPSAALVWALCDGTRTVADIAAALIEEFPAAGAIVADVAEAVGMLADRGVVDP